MNNIIEQVDAWLAALGFAAAMLTFWGFGWWRGERLRAEPGENPGTKFTDASMAILGLLLAFTFAMSLGRHDLRQAAVVAESNALGDFYTCASLLKGQTRSDLQSVIRDYIQLKLSVVREAAWETETDLPGSLLRCQQLHARMTDIVAQAVAEGTPIAVPLTNTLNNVTGSNTSFLAAYRQRLPGSIVLLLFLGSIVPAFLMGLEQGEAKKVHLSGTLGFILLVTLVIFVALDLNQPTRGLITVNQEPLEQLAQTVARSAEGREMK